MLNTLERLRCKMINQKAEAFNRCWSKYYKEHSWNYMDEELSSDLAYYFWKSALEQPTQEPMIIKQDNGMVLKLGYDDLPNGTSFYTHPKEWQGLSDEEIWDIANFLGKNKEWDYPVMFAKTIEQALKEKQNE